VIKPYGSEELFINVISRDTLEQISSSEHVKLCLSDSDLADCYRLSDGSLTPVDSFMGREEVNSLLQNGTLLSGIYFPIPILRAIPKDIFNKKPECLLICKSGGEPKGYIEVSEYFTHDEESISKFIFNRSSGHHPGVARFQNQGNHYVSGKVYMLKDSGELSKYCYSPTELRQIIKDKSIKSIAGFQTRNVPHLAHEYLQRLALEMCDGLLINPILGWKKANDYLPEVVISTYKCLIENYYPKDKVILSGLQLSMYYAGPKEAILHAIIRQNYGCTHFIVGRDHAGVGDHYHKYAGHELADKVQDQLDIKILKMKGPFYCNKCRMITSENICVHDKENVEEISGTYLRQLLLEKKMPQGHLLREEVVKEIFKHDEIFIPE